MVIERTHKEDATLLKNAIISRVLFSNCEGYRYLLERIWDRSLGLVNFVMLNPSTATETDNDPTAKRCEERALRMGYGGFVITNLFAFRATDPCELAKPSINPIWDGLQSNDAIIADTAGQADMIICAWGDSLPKTLSRRANDVLDVLKTGNRDKLHHLGLNKSGNPKHPLYIGYDKNPQRFYLQSQ